MLIAVMIRVHYAWCLVSPKVSVWAGTNGHLLSLQYTTGIFVYNLVCLVLKPYMVLQMKGNAHAHSPWRPNSPTTHAHMLVADQCGG